MGATPSIVARRLLKQAKIRKTKTVAKELGMVGPSIDFGGSM